METRGEGGFVIVAPSHGTVHPSGKPWVLACGGPSTTPVLTVVEREQLHRVIRSLDQMPQPAPEPEGFTQPPRDHRGGKLPGDDYNERADWADILTPIGWTLLWTSPDGTRNWKRPGKTAPGMSATTDRPPHHNLFVFSTSTEFEDLKSYTKFGAYALLNYPGNYKAASAQLRREGYGEDPPAPPAAASGGRHRTRTDGDPPGAAGPPRTQDDWARRFAAQITGMRYVHGLGWHVWDGQRWRQDDIAQAVKVMSDLILSGYAELKDVPASEAKYAVRDLAAARRASGISGALTLAAARPQLAVAVRQVDAHPQLLNTASGTLDLATMTLREHDPAQLLTKACRGGYRPGLGETRWTKFVAEILPDEQVRAFVRRLMGVAIFGAVIEHVLAVLWGNGRNGKSTFIEAIMHALGDYALQADAKLLLSGASDRHSTERADLQGKRLAVCMETAKGRQVDAAMAKQLTGGDTVTARRMRMDNISFEPSHTVMLVSNYKPVVPGDDDALWKRIRLIPFTQRFLGQQADKGLLAALKAEPDAGNHMDG